MALSWEVLEGLAIEHCAVLRAGGKGGLAVACFCRHFNPVNFLLLKNFTFYDVFCLI
jgi:hypothetical protein